MSLFKLYVLLELLTVFVTSCCQKNNRYIHKTTREEALFAVKGEPPFDPVRFAQKKTDVI